jgi:formylglycine-generating enzyme required for sulfatase activity
LAPGLTSLQFVGVGDPGNSADSTGYGTVSYTYDIGKFDITAAQYSEFLNAVARTDLYGLYNINMNSAYGANIVRTGAAGSYLYSVAADFANRPVNYVSWGDAARFCNWLQNGQKSGAQDATTTEDGAYFLNGAVTQASLLAVTRKAGAQFFLPTEDEWYKTAFYDPNKPGGAGYWDYPTKSDAPPSNVLSATGTNNANYNYSIGNPYRTEVGAFAASPGPYGTFDQGGNVKQWNETKIGNSRGIRGGDYTSATAAPLAASTGRDGTLPVAEDYSIGFRIAGILQSTMYSWKGSPGDTMTAWGVTANWTPVAEVPDGPGVNVLFGNQAEEYPIVDMISVGRTVANIVFVDYTGTLIQSTYGHSLTLDNNGHLSTIDVAGDHFISAAVIMNNDLNVAGTGSLTFWGGLSGPHQLTVTGELIASSVKVDSLVIGTVGSALSVPEPSSIALLLGTIFGFAGHALWRRKSRGTIGPVG